MGMGRSRTSFTTDDAKIFGRMGGRSRSRVKIAQILINRHPERTAGVPRPSRQADPFMKVKAIAPDADPVIKAMRKDAATRYEARTMASINRHLYRYANRAAR
jgi:hypothetical protein